MYENRFNSTVVVLRKCKNTFFSNFTQRTGMKLLKHDGNRIEYKHICMYLKKAFTYKKDINESLEQKTNTCYTFFSFSFASFKMFYCLFNPILLSSYLQCVCSSKIIENLKSHTCSRVCLNYSQVDYHPQAIETISCQDFTSSSSCN